MKEGAEVPTFICSSKGGKDGSPRVRVFDKAGEEIKGIPTRGWASLTVDDPVEGSERGSVAPSFIPLREGNESALDPLAPLAYTDSPESQSDDFSSEDEEPVRIFFGKGTNLIILKQGRLESEKEAQYAY
ncbi:hypothetical protein ABG768_025963 [Culter alburnus]|uniref:Uncharacterized protein n=1 Tax=Culter alburnus TaxID=194366 RepID=A0AAW2AIU4_CULAL